MTTASAATSTNAVAPARPHYVILDGLRGVASLTVVIFHLFEAFANDDPQKQIVNHGYLAVDFFFLLSGFVIAYAYDDRWPAGLTRAAGPRFTQWEFYKRRLIRLQPMVILGSLLGGALFYFGKGSFFPSIAHTPMGKMLLVMLLGCTLLPLPYQFDIRGWHEMHPLNGPAWSLFFEYLANIFYAAGLRKLSQRALAILVALAGLLLLQVALFGGHGDLIGGWSLAPAQLHIGFARLLFPFFAGMLLMRSGRRIRMRHAFPVASLLLLVAFALPRFGGLQHLWANGLYDSAVVILLFPLIVAIGAGEQTDTGPSLRIARFFGDLSYPLYITHYPLIYLYTAFVAEHHTRALPGAVLGAALLLTAVLIAYASLKLYDEPLRRFLSRRFLSPTPRTAKQG